MRILRETFYSMKLEMLMLPQSSTQAIGAHIRDTHWIKDGGLILELGSKY